MYDMKALYEAYTVEEAVRLRLEHPEAQIIAGGTDVLVQMREGRRAGKELISIQKIDSMRGVSMDEDENIRIGSLTTFSHITHNPIIMEKINVLGEAVDMVGGPQIRNAGTIGGNTCNGGAHLIAPYLVALLIVGGQEYYDGVRVLGLYQLAQLKTVPIWQVNVQQH